jgi:molybdopterin-synthase adenylyltransferase
MTERSHIRALVVGAGGLGCPALLGLAEAGVGTIRLVDDDRVDLSNLQRQVLYGASDVGSLKVEAARARLEARFPALRLEIEEVRINLENAPRLLEGVDVVLDATDDPEARFVINDQALAQGIPAVLGGVIRFEGLVMGVHPAGGACFRCLFEGPPEAGEVLTCAAAGVLGAMSGVVGHLQVERALALLDGDLERATGQITTVDGLRGTTRHVTVPSRPTCTGCSPGPTSSFLTSHSFQEFKMSIAIKIPTSLRRFVGGQDQVDVAGVNVREALDGLEAAHPGIKAKICDAEGNLRRFINVYADQEDIRFLDNLETALGDGAELQIVPAIAGG